MTIRRFFMRFSLLNYNKQITNRIQGNKGERTNRKTDERKRTRTRRNHDRLERGVNL